MRGVGVLLLTMLARMRALSSPRAASALARCVTPRHIPLVARYNPAPRLLSTDTAPQRRNAFLQTVKEAARLSEVIAESGVHVDDSGSSIKATCPFHGDGNERTPSLNIDDEQGLYHCFACGASGNVFSYLMDYENVEFKEALAMLAKRYGIRPTADEARGRGARRSSDAVVAAHERLLHALEASLVSVSATQPLAWPGQVSQSVISTQPLAWPGQSVSQFYTTPSMVYRLTRSCRSPDGRVFLSSQASAVYYAGKLRDPTAGKACISLLKKRRVTQRSAIAFRLGYAPGGPGSAADALTSYLLEHEDRFQPDELEKARSIR